MQLPQWLSWVRSSSVASFPLVHVPINAGQDLPLRWWPALQPLQWLCCRRSAAAMSLPFEQTPLYVWHWYPLVVPEHVPVRSSLALQLVFEHAAHLRPSR